MEETIRSYKLCLRRRIMIHGYDDSRARRGFVKTVFEVCGYFLIGEPETVRNRDVKQNPEMRFLMDGPEIMIMNVRPQLPQEAFQIFPEFSR